ncbi:hypothetical protein MKW92_044041 [Papaver armeniacum]|nr:hypothetical protein MKW92_044041 [Papaver armeniacum]
MFMSKHFVFPPSQHENLPVQPDCSNSVTQDSLHHNEVSRLDMEEGEKSEKFDEDSWNIKGLEVLEELHHSQFFDEKGENSPLCEESISFQGIKLVNKEDIIDMNANLCSYHDVEASLSASRISESTTVMPEPGAAAKLDSSSKISESHNPPEEDTHGLPCEACKDANALWSVVVAAALMGFVGHMWQRESSQGRQLKWHFSISDEGLEEIVCPLSKAKRLTCTVLSNFFPFICQMTHTYFTMLFFTRRPINYCFSFRSYCFRETPCCFSSYPYETLAYDYF